MHDGTEGLVASEGLTEQALLLRQRIHLLGGSVTHLNVSCKPLGLCVKHFKSHFDVQPALGCAADMCPYLTVSFVPLS